MNCIQASSDIKKKLEAIVVKAKEDAGTAEKRIPHLASFHFCELRRGIPGIFSNHPAEEIFAQFMLHIKGECSCIRKQKPDGF